MALGLNGMIESWEGWCVTLHEKMKYINHRNEVIEFGSRNLFINEMDLRDYAWNYDTAFGRIDNFRREAQERELTISIYGKTELEVNQRKNEVFEVFEKDVLASKPGKLWIGDYYLSCYVFEGSISAYYRQGNYLAKEIKIVTDEPYWIKETSSIFKPSDEGQSERSFYNYDYPYGYSNNLGIRDINNNHFIEIDIKLIIYGPVSNPTIYIKGHQYKVNTELLAGEYLTISTKDKTVIKTKSNGETVNEFYKRDKAYNIFKKISPGSSFVSWDESFTFEIIVVEERSEPKWT